MDGGTSRHSLPAQINRLRDIPLAGTRGDPGAAARHTLRRPALERGPDEWLATFADPLRAQSAIDRSVNNAYDLVVDGESYRQRQHPAGAGAREGASSAYGRSEGCFPLGGHLKTGHGGLQEGR